ncbi:tetratricopeptide repeat protein [Streptomyces sp. NPDC054834]
MAQARPSMQELIRQRRRAGFVGRGAERAAFRENFDHPPENERHRFLFHVHGDAGIGKTFLVREMEQIARDHGALTAYVDEGFGSVPEAMAAISRQVSAQGGRFKELDRLLAAHRERRHEAEGTVSATLEPGPEQPSAGSLAVARAGLVGLGMVPGVGAFAGALDAARLAQQTDRLRAGLSARFRSQDDVQLVLSPEQVLTPVMLGELSEAASLAPWIVLFFDTYEVTASFLDGWLYDVMVTDRYGASLPSNTVVVTAGQRRLDPSSWSGFADFVQDVPLQPFTKDEARGLLAAKGVVAEPVVEEVLRLTGGLPVLVSTLAEARPEDPDDVGDPSETAVERFLKWERDPVRRAAALAGALPRRLDADVFRTTVDCPEEEADALFTWLRSMPFVGEHGDGLRYHDVVRGPILRLQRRHAPRRWAEVHERLAGVFARWREETANDLRPDELWKHEPWRELYLEETYHLLCARPSAALGRALHSLVEACRHGRGLGGVWARMLDDAGVVTDTSVLRDCGRLLGGALADEAAGVRKAMDLLLSRPWLDRTGRALAHTLRGRELRNGGEIRRALDDYHQAVELDPQLAWAYYGRGFTHALLGDTTAALADTNRADELAPDTPWIVSGRGEILRLAQRFQEAIAEFDHALAIDPTDADSLACRAVCRHALGQYDDALADFDRALTLDADDLWTLVRRARLRRARDEWDEAFDDLDRAARLAPDSAWIASERGDAYRLAGRFEEAVTELGRAISLNPENDSVLASRGAAHHGLGHADEALADLDRAVELDPDYSWALVTRARVRRGLGDMDGMFDDLRRAAAADPDANWIHVNLGEAYWLADRLEEALAVFRRVLERDPDYEWALACCGATHSDLKDYPEALGHLDRALTKAPDYGWAYAQRARVFRAMGRVAPTLADLEQCVRLGQDANWARRNILQLLMWSGRWDEAMARLAAVDEAMGQDSDWDEVMARAHRQAGRWAAARAASERMRAVDPLDGTLQLALTVGAADGLSAASSLWHELARMLDRQELDEAPRALALCVIGWALEDWAGADRGMGRLLATHPGWNVLADLADFLIELMSSPGADRVLLAPRLAAVVAARDAVQARYAE